MHHAPLIIDIAGTTLNADDCRRLQHPLVGGVIYFSRNWENRQQITALSSAIKKIRPDILISVDNEGGRVQRLRSDGFTHLPSMRSLGQYWRKPDPVGMEGTYALEAAQIATHCGYVLASELRACGIDLSYTPVLDLDYGNSAVIGDRAFDSDPRITSVLAKSLMHGLLQAGMGNCGKHFPGHGYVQADSHVEIPVDQRDLRSILHADALPYGWLGNVLTAVMPAHVIYPLVDSCPAGFSARWLNDILRQQLGFNGAIISDDLSMQGARQLDGEQLTFTQATLAAMDAGCDLVLICNQSLDGGQLLDEVIDGLSEAALKGWWQPSDVSEERRRAMLPTMPALPWDELVRSPQYIQALESIALLG